jgi:uncharacterized protein
MLWCVPFRGIPLETARNPCGLPKLLVARALREHSQSLNALGIKSGGETGLLADCAALSMHWLFLGASLACAGFVQGLSGFGFGLVSMSLLPLFMGIKQAAVISTAFSLLATILTFVRHYRAYEWRQGAGFLASVCIGLPVGVYFLEKGSESLLIRALGGLMLAYAAREFFFPTPAKTFPPWLTVPLGLFSGAMSGAFNLGGVPSAAYAYAQPWSRGQIMAFLQVMITLTCALRMLFYHKAGLVGDIAWAPALALTVPVVAAIWLGHLALKHIPLRPMRQGIFVFLAVSGAYYLLVRH